MGEERRKGEKKKSSVKTLGMEEKLVQRLEEAVARLEALSAGFRPSTSPEDSPDASLDPAIAGFDDLMKKFVGRVSAAAEKIGGKVLEVTKILEEAFSVQKDLLVKVKQSQVCFGFPLVRIVLFVADLFVLMV